LTTFLSTHVNKVDRKGRVSVPAAWRPALAGQGFQGIVALRSLTLPALDGFGRETLERINARRLDRTLEGGDFAAFLGRAPSPQDEMINTLMSMVHELPFDSEGRIALPRALADHAGISDEAAFVGHGNSFQIWAPAAHEAHLQAALARARAQAGGNGGAA
jgi:transcriptional regulator MraZ